MKIVEEVVEVLNLLESRREKVYALSREIRRSSTRAIVLIHREEIEEAERLLGEVREKLDMLTEQDYNFPFLTEALQEYAEAELLLSFITQREPAGFRELKVTPEAFLLGLGDVVGELRRHVLELLSRGEISKAKKYLRLMEELTSELMAIHYPSAIVNIKRKQDVARATLERTISDVVRAEMESELTKSLKAASSDLPYTEEKEGQGEQNKSD